MFNLFKKKQTVQTKSFFEYPAGEKKKIIKEAAQKANKMQQDLVKRYNKLYPAY